MMRAVRHMVKHARMTCGMYALHVTFLGAQVYLATQVPDKYLIMSYCFIVAQLVIMLDLTKHLIKVYRIARSIVILQDTIKHQRGDSDE